MDNLLDTGLAELKTVGAVVKKADAETAVSLENVETSETKGDGMQSQKLSEKVAETAHSTPVKSAVR